MTNQTNATVTSTTVRTASLLAVMAGMALGTTARAQNTWTNGTGNSNWYTNGNWSTGAFPNPGHSVVIPVGFPTVSASGAFCANLTALSPLSVGNGGTGVSGSASLKDFTTTGGFLCPGPVTLTGSVQVDTSSFWTSTSGFTSSGMFNVTNMPLNQTKFTNTGTLKVENGSLTVGGAATTLDNSGTLELRADGHLKSTGKLKNTGSWSKVGASDSEVQCNVDHMSGTLDVQEGLLRLTGGGFNKAPMTIEIGSRIRLEGPFVNLGHFFDAGAQITGGGELSLMFFDGVFSHAVRKRPKAGDYRVQFQFGGTNENASVSSELVAQANVCVAGAPALPVYARVDGVVKDGRFLLMELEVFEPLMFLARHAEAPARFARAIEKRLLASRA
ncbi:MAG: hypothetical protein ACKVW3_03360 [Phycisphaerales bacterium]